MPRQRASISEQIIEPVDGLPRLLVVRSAARRKTISAQVQDDGSVRLLVPAALSRSQILAYAQELVPKIQARKNTHHEKKQHAATEQFLKERAKNLVARFLPELESISGLQIRWVTNQGKRWGSCTPAQKSIRISHVLQGSPEYVLDYVVHHELCHLLERTHNQRFKSLESRYPEMTRAEAFLDGIIFGQNK